MNGVRSQETGLVIDNFAGGGGASTGIEAALGRHIDFAINHDAQAIAMHRVNHPNTTHLQTSVWDVNPRTLARGRTVDLGWFSPDCTFHSKARGGKPFRDRNVARRRRGLAGIVPRWLHATGMQTFFLENVEEFADWGPLLADGRICPKRRGMLFRRWHRQIENLGYRIDMRELRACDYGAPTTRKRLFVIGRRDGGEIVFPEATHGNGLLPYRTAAECIDFSDLGQSIFLTPEQGRAVGVRRPLADATLRRIARGVVKYVLQNPRPFILRFRGDPAGGALDIESPLPTITSGSFIKRPAGAGHALGVCTPLLAHLTHQGNRRVHVPSEPLPTITGANRGEMALVAPTLINTRNGERMGQAPRALDIQRPYGTITAEGSQGAMVATFLARHYGGHENDGAAVAQPFYTITSKDHHALVAAFLMKYYGAGDNIPPIEDPLAAITCKDRFGLVTVQIAGEPYYIADIRMRMLKPRELYRAQSFPSDYIIDRDADGNRFTTVDQVRMVGNSVPPAVAEALVRANIVEQRQERAA